jgi:hypothetical protein
MSKLLINLHALPEHLLSRIHSGRVMVREDNGTITVTPVHENSSEFAGLRGMFAGSGMST